jgi:hypothetical protein
LGFVGKGKDAKFTTGGSASRGTFSISQHVKERFWMVDL